MSEYLIQGETLSALADEVRTLSGTTDELTTEEMNTNLNTANGVIDNQADLLAQIQSVLATKTGGTDTSDATAGADDITLGEIAYANGVKLIGTNPYEKAATTAEVNTQASKLDELKTILAGKVGGGSGGSNTIETCTVQIVSSETIGDVLYTTVENGVMVIKYENGTNKTLKCVCGSFIVIDCGINGPVISSYGAEDLRSTSGDIFFGYDRIRPFKIIASANENATIIIDIGGGN